MSQYMLLNTGKVTPLSVLFIKHRSPVSVIPDEHKNSLLSLKFDLKKPHPNNKNHNNVLLSNPFLPALHLVPVSIHDYYCIK